MSKEKKRYWTLRCGREQVQFEKEELVYKFERPDYWIGQVYMYLCPRLAGVELIKEN
jgi:hypothetical protein